MKWSDLTLKERKQIYDAVRAENPNASYFDIKSQFDSIPEYEDGVSSINLNEQWRKPVGGGMPRWEKANEDFKKLLSGLNKTVGTAFTGASLATTGIWNAARLLNIGKGSNWRLAAAKNALTGSKAGLAADIGNFIEEPTVTNGVQVILPKVGSKDLTTTSNKIVNTISTGFDFDDLTEVPTYEDGGKKVTPPKELGLTPGTPEYYKRQQQISGRAELVQPEAYVTPAGYIKDAITTAEELEKGNYGNAAVSTLMNAIPWGVGKGLRKIKSRVSNTLNTPIEIHSSMVDEYPSILAEKARRKTSKNKKKVKEESDYDSEFSEVIRRDRNIKKYEKEINKTIEDAILPDKKTYELVKGIDTAYGTDYLDAYKRIAARDMTGRGKYIKYAELPDNKNAKISRVRDVQDYGPVVDDYVITIDPLQYLPGTANHELGHLADQLASDANNRYLTYLLDEGNIMGPGELRSKGINVGSDMQSYLLDPSESKSHMLHLKRALVNEGKIHDWSSKVNQNTIEDFLFDPRNTGVVNNANKLQYNMYRNKSRFVDRINNLTPMEFITPLLLPVAGYETNKE
ncbi:hypothetical protein M1M45_gp022 [uncultured phage cr149_1]|uniref:Uncharacterized protein n=1 Tax=uncultured phage cr149_1 TaxID=2986412 RepID=A0AAE7V221_9CAUD|nr:hypothetical protein M1M45_gp022 [uncultured phage cr149_1]QWM89289.1 hypothetical protein [uncultured phage cr149_1]